MKAPTKKHTIHFAAAAILIFLMIWTIWGNTALEVNWYEISSERLPQSFSGFRIAQISDLHNAEFGEGNGELISLLSRTEPDIIVITGDLIDFSHTDIDIALEFAQQAVKIAPVYYVTGNHEACVAEFYDLKNSLLEAGVTVLENEKLELTRENKCITLIGVQDPSFMGDYLLGSATVTDIALSGLQNESDDYAILLAHRPELFDTYAEFGMNLVFSGHAHGGQFRLPLLGGLVAPNQGLFPKYDAGLFQKDNTTMIVSRGLGNSIIPLRFNNRPEIVVAELKTTD